MKYTIVLDQQSMIDWDLSFPEATILYWFTTASTWCKASRVIDDQVFYWVQRSKAIEQFPYLTDKEDTMYRHYKSLEKKELITLKRIDDKDYMKLTEKGSSWGSKKESNDDSEKNPSRKKIRGKSEKNPGQVGKKSEKTQKHYIVDEAITDATISDEAITKKGLGNPLQTETEKTEVPPSRSPSPEMEKIGSGIEEEGIKFPIPEFIPDGELIVDGPDVLNLENISVDSPDRTEMIINPSESAHPAPSQTDINPATGRSYPTHLKGKLARENWSKWYPNAPGSDLPPLDARNHTWMEYEVADGIVLTLNQNNALDPDWWLWITEQLRDATTFAEVRRRLKAAINAKLKQQNAL